MATRYHLPLTLELTYEQAELLRAVLDDAVRFGDADFSGDDLRNVDDVSMKLSDALDAADEVLAS